MTEDEMFQSHVLATKADQARCGSPVLARSHLSRSSAIMLAGNAMNIPCVGAALLAAIMAVERV